MLHYYIKVPACGDTLTTRETIVSRVEYYNNRQHYLLFESGDDAEIRFVMVCEKRLTKTALTELKNIFEVAVQAEEINTASVSHDVLKKIKTAKALMTDNDYCGNQKTLLFTDNLERIYEKADAAVGLARYKEFLAFLSGYIDRTAEMTAKSLYNVVLINEHGVNLDQYTELLYGLYAAKGLLLEYVMIKGDMDDARRTDKETRFVYVIEDKWKVDDSDEYFRASDEVKVLKKIRRSSNIYVTSMKQADYQKLSALDSFEAAFPHVFTIDMLTTEEKIEFIRSVAGEYGFTVDTDGMAGSRMIGAATVDKLETAMRKAVQRKLTAKEKRFEVKLSDLDMKAKKIRKISALDELEGLIGLDNVKKTVKEIVTFLKRRGRNAVPCLHMAFLGNPGTGKTTVARIIARIFAEARITKKDLLVETDRGGLIGLYVGHTAGKTANKIESAMGGVLFIDEAYSLFVEDKIDYGNEAVATLVKAMEDRRDEFVCILAGYTSEMNAMLDMNPGLRDRIQFYIEFQDYSEPELVAIFEKLCKDNKYRLTEPAVEALRAGFARIVNAKSQNFSNGRLVRKVFERMRIKQAMRTEGNTITDADVDEVFAEKDIAALLGESRGGIGFRSAG